MIILAISIALYNSFNTETFPKSVATALVALLVMVIIVGIFMVSFNFHLVCHLKGKYFATYKVRKKLCQSNPPIVFPIETGGSNSVEECGNETTEPYCDCGDCILDCGEYKNCDYIKLLQLWRFRKRLWEL